MVCPDRLVVWCKIGQWRPDSTSRTCPRHGMINRGESITNPQSLLERVVGAKRLVVPALVLQVWPLVR